MNAHSLFLGRRPHAVISTAHALACDLETVVRGGVAFEAIIENAPILDDWCFAPRLVPAIEADRSSPEDGVIERAITSELFVVDTVHGWCRTRNRFYRLGRRLR